MLAGECGPLICGDVTFLRVEVVGRVVDRQRRAFLQAGQGLDTLGQAKVSQSCILIMIQKDILRFDVPVNYISLVQIIYGFESLPKNFPLKLFAGSSWVIFHELLEGLTIAVLHLDVEDLDAFFGRCRAECLPLTYHLLAILDH